MPTRRSGDGGGCVEPEPTHSRHGLATVILGPDGGPIYGPSSNADLATMAIGSDGTLYGYGSGDLSALR